MNLEYRKYTPEDLFISFRGRETTEEERWHGLPQGIIHNKPTGNEFIDLFAALVHRHMHPHPGFYAKELGVTARELSGCMKVLTGLPTDEWIGRYRWLAVCDLLLHTGWPLHEIAGKTGYGSVKTFSRAFIEHFGIPATWWRSRNK